MNWVKWCWLLWCWLKWCWLKCQHSLRALPLRARLMEFRPVADLSCSTADLSAQLYRIECFMVDVHLMMSNLVMCTCPWNMHSPCTQPTQSAVLDPCELSQPQDSGNHEKPSSPSKSKLRRQRAASTRRRLWKATSLVGLSAEDGFWPDGFLPESKDADEKYVSANLRAEDGEFIRARCVSCWEPLPCFSGLSGSCISCQKHFRAAQLDGTSSEDIWSVEEIENWTRLTMRIANQAATQELDKEICKDKRSESMRQQKCKEIRSELIRQRWETAKAHFPQTLHSGFLEVLLEM